MLDRNASAQDLQSLSDYFHEFADQLLHLSEMDLTPSSDDQPLNQRALERDKRIREFYIGNTYDEIERIVMRKLEAVAPSNQPAILPA